MGGVSDLAHSVAPLSAIGHDRCAMMARLSSTPWTYAAASTARAIAGEWPASATYNAGLE
jgi:hypothetical protein